jgi:hypothetical protein
MTDFTDHLASIEGELSKERGPFVLFALLAHEDLPDRWDLMVSAPWIDSKDAIVDDLVARIASKAGREELINLSRIVVAAPNDPAVVAFNKAFRAEHKRLDIRDSVLFNQPIKHAIVITSRRPDVLVNR